MAWHGLFHFSHITDLEVANNPLQGVDDGGKLAHVEHYAFSADGSWLATVDYRPAPDLNNNERSRRFRQKVARGADELSLKFWHYESSAQQFVLNSIVDRPYKSGTIVGIAFHPKRNCVATVSQSGKVKIWTPMHQASAASDDEDNDANNNATPEHSSALGSRTTYWRCEHVSQYRVQGATSVCYSTDGSLLAVSYGNVISLWQDSFEAIDDDGDGLTCIIYRSTLTNLPANEVIQRLTFVASSPFLVASTSSKRIVVWNLLSGIIAWSCTANVQYLVADQYAVSSTTARFLAIVSSATDGMLLSLSLSLSLPVCVCVCVCVCVWLTPQLSRKSTVDKRVVCVIASNRIMMVNTVYSIKSRIYDHLESGIAKTTWHSIDCRSSRCCCVLLDRAS
jgi:NET1-associated nuclear protein 1 (U3 small nucleolar RNA-associated protein 17)